MNSNIKHALRSRLLIGVACSILFAGCAPHKAPSTTNNPEIRKAAITHYQLGMNAIVNNKLPRAFKELLLSNELLPRQPETISAIAYAWRLRGDVKKADTNYKLALRWGGGSDVKNNYATFLNSQEKYRRALALAKSVISDPVYPRLELAYMNLGDAQFGLEENKKALDSYRKGLKYSAGNPELKIRLAKTYIKLGRFHEGIHLYRDLAKGYSNSRPVVEGLVEVLVQMGSAQEARHILSAFKEKTLSAEDSAWAIEQLEKLPY